MGRRRTLEEVQVEALKYSTRSDFQKNAGWAYLWARRRGLCDQVCAHMTPLHTRWTKEAVAVEAAKYSKRSDFQRHSPNAYKAAYAHGWLDDVCQYDFHRVLRKWSDEDLAAEASKYQSYKEFREGAPNAYHVAGSRGILGVLCAHMQKWKTKKWTLDALHDEAARFSRRKDFQTQSNSAYTVAARCGVMDEVCAHMDIEWRRVSDEEVISKASEYSTLSDLCRHDNSYYTLAIRRKMLGSVITHLLRKESGFKYEETAQLYVLLIDHPSLGEYVGYGISGDVQKRLTTHEANLRSAGYAMRVVGVTEPLIGYDIHALECLISEGIPSYGIPVDGFRRECVAIDHLEDLVAIVESFVNINYGLDVIYSQTV